MRYLRYEYEGEIRYGVLEEGAIRPLEGEIFGEYTLDKSGPELSEVKLLAPLEPKAVYAIGLNYEKHIEEFKHIDETRDIPKLPITFMCAPSAVIGPEEPILLDNPEDPIHFEVELVVVIGKRAEAVSEEEALDYVFGYTIGNDVSNRAQQQMDRQWFRAKSHASYKPMGPWIETELDPKSLAIQSKINGELRQDGNTRDLIFKVPQLIAHISAIAPLEPGDVIYTGTPDGVGPLKDGDNIVMEIEGLGQLSNDVRLAK